MESVLKQKGREMLLGNEAIVRGALEAGVQFVSVYPGTPSSEIGIVFSKIAKQRRVYFEYSANEKTALEAGIGASFSGLKTLIAMKNFGLNVASDALLPFCYTGSKGPTVIIVADDPSCHSSAQSEENSRGFAMLAHIPILEPSDSEECREFVKLGFKLSEKFNLPVMARLTTRVAHQRSPVLLGKLKINAGSEALGSGVGVGAGAGTGAPILNGKFVKDKHRFVTMPPRVMEMHQELLNNIARLGDFAETSPANAVSKVKGAGGASKARGSKIGIITSGVSYLYVMEALKSFKLNLPVLKLGFFYPLPSQKIKDFIKPLKKVLIVEELEPFLEKEIKMMAKDVNPKLQIFGKIAGGAGGGASKANTAVLPQTGEFGPDDVVSAVARISGRKSPINVISAAGNEISSSRVKHLPRFCASPSCPYWKVFAAVKKAVRESGINEKDVLFGGDIGCYMIAALPPHELYDYLSCMGSSIGIAHGVAKAVDGKQKVIAFIGDGTFFHAGIPALINAVYNKSNVLVMILDNRITAMTGHQPNPGMGLTGMGDRAEEIEIESLVRALKVKNVKTLDPVEQFDELTAAIKEFMPKKEVSVIITRRTCALLAKRQAKAK